MILKFRSEKKLPKNKRHEKNPKISTMIEKLSLCGDVGNSMPQSSGSIKITLDGSPEVQQPKPIVKMVLIMRSGDVLGSRLH